MLFKSNLLLLLDSNSILHRAFHALPPLFNSKGEPTQAIYGGLRIVFKVLKEFSPKYLASAFDLPVPTFREEMFKEYKAQRPKTPKELTFQIEKFKEVLKAFSIPVYQKSGFEADDVIATISDLSLKENPNLRVIIVSGDLDLLQLVSEKIQVYTFKKGVKEEVIYDLDRIKERFGLEPWQLVDFKALKGDVSDNVPGVKGIGEKTAKQLLAKFGSLEGIYQNLESALKERIITLKQYQSLKANKDQAFFNKELLEVKRNLELNFKLEDCSWESYNKKEAFSILKELEFKSLLSKLP